MTDQYPKITQEALEASIVVLMGNMQDPEYLNGSPYSALMKAKIKTLTDKFKNMLDAGELNTSGNPEGDLNHDLENADIKRQFSDLNEAIETRSEEYRDRYGILVRLEKIVRNMERMSTKGSSDTVKMSAMTKFLDFQQGQVDVLLKLTNVEKAQKIEAITRRFFQEIKKTESLTKIADRYLALLNDLD